MIRSWILRSRQAILEGVVSSSGVQQNRTTEEVRPEPQRRHPGHPVALSLAAAHQRSGRHQQQDQSHQANGLRFPRRRTLFPRSQAGLTRSSVKNPVFVSESQSVSRRPTCRCGSLAPRNRPNASGRCLQIRAAASEFTGKRPLLDCHAIRVLQCQIDETGDSTAFVGNLDAECR